MKSQLSDTKIQIVLCHDCYQHFETQHVLAVARHIMGVAVGSKAILPTPTPTPTPAPSQASATVGDAGMNDKVTDELARIDGLSDIDEKLAAIDKLLLQLGLSWRGMQQPADKAIHLRPVCVIPAPKLVRAHNNGSVKRPASLPDPALPSKRQATVKRGRPPAASNTPTQPVTATGKFPPANLRWRYPAWIIQKATSPA